MRLSFRLKLLLAMMAVVAGVTGATLYVTSRRVQSTYDQLFEQQFQTQVGFLRELRAARMSGVRSRCAEFRKNVRVRGLLRRINRSAASGDSADVADSAEKLYQTAEDELRTLLRTSFADGKVQRAALYRLLDEHGRVIEPPPGVDAGFTTSQARASLRQQLEPIGKALGSQIEQNGYLAQRTASGQEVLLDVLFVRIGEEESDEIHGTLVLGFGVPGFSGEAPGTSAGDLGAANTAFLINDTVYAPWLNETNRAALANDVSTRIKQAPLHSYQTPALHRLTQRVSAGIRRVPSEAANDFVTTLGGAPYRVFFEPLNAGSLLPPAYQLCLYPLAQILTEQRALHLWILAFGGLGLVGAFVFSALLSHGLSVPIRELVRATGEVREGNLETKVTVRSADEIGQLAASFNEMTEGLALKERYRSVLNMVADKTVAEELMTGQVQLGGENRKLSVLFCDIRGFTAMTQNMPPAEVIQMLNEHMTLLTRVVYEHKGVVDKFVGDLIMAIFGAPKSYGQDSWNAARCALDMIAARSELNERSRYKISVGIGVATGPAVAGCMGSSDRLNYTVLGERVNLASRLCSQAGRMDVVVDQTTRDELGGAADVEPLPELRLKGFSDAVRAYKLNQLRKSPSQSV